ncbi:MucBP domain-containing protein [Mycoplasma sp. P36-A1]|uniref:MucBP domain-containing protein n=1 Tax=Mycoplasma sp. P36-A1 TaxID=3252900 RepID=UPI003C2E75DA
MRAKKRIIFKVISLVLAILISNSLYINAQNINTETVDTSVAGFSLDQSKGYVHIQYLDSKTKVKIEDDITIAGTMNTSFEYSLKDITGYSLQSSSTSYTIEDNVLKGTYTSAKTEIQLEYAALGKITVRYIDDQKNELANDKVFNTPNNQDNQDFSESAIPITGYELEDNQNIQTQKYPSTEQEITITFIYKKVEENATAVIKYIDISTNKEIETSESKTGIVGNAISENVKTIPGYIYLDKQSINMHANFSNDNNEVLIKYVSENYQSKVIIKYQEYETKNTIKEDKIITSKINTQYSVLIPDIPTYYYHGKIGDEKGNYTYEDREVTFLYTKDYVKAHTSSNINDQNTKTIYLLGNYYIDITTGKDLYPADIYSRLDGESSNSLPMEIEGYTLVKTEGEIKAIINKDRNVYFYYKPINTNTPTTKTEEKIIKEREAKTEVQYTDYDTKSALAPFIKIDEKDKNNIMNNPKIIAGYTFIKTDLSKDATHNIINLRYKKNTSVEQASITVKYIDSVSKKEIAKENIINGYIDASYLINAITIDQYQLVSKQSQVNGIYTENKKIIYFEYELNNVKANNVNEPKTSKKVSDKIKKEISNKKLKIVNKLPVTGSQLLMMATVLAIICALLILKKIRSRK